MGKNKHRQPKPGQPSEKPKQAGPLNQAEMDAVLRNMVLQQMSADPKTRGLLTHDVLKSLAPRKPAEPTKTKSPEELMRDCINAELARLQPIEPPTVHAGEEPYFPLPPFSEEGKKTMAVGVERGFPNRHLGVAFAFKAKEGVEMQVFDIPHIKLKAEDGDKGKDFGMNYDVSAVHSKWRECKAAGREPLSVILIYHSFPIHWDVENMFDLSKKLEERGVNTPVYGLGVDMQKKAEGKEYVIGSMNLFRVNPKVSEAEFRQALGVCRATAQEFYNACGGVREKIADELMPVAMSTAVRNNQKLSEPALRMTEPLVDLLKGFLTRKFERIKPTRPPEDEYAVDKEIQALVGFALKYRKRLIDHNFGNAMTKRADP
ncbi:MAG: hypothetical protein FJY77_06320, partial [Candidatus Altiarchaeales archaeon]|nr:hypothetical protein [Candidatus Altiarchaeales archaeon]